MATDRAPTLGEGVAIDVNRLIVSRLLVQANSGGGKSYALRRLLEQTFGLCQHIVLDPEGEFHTLREKHAYVLVGPGGEAPATVKNAALLAIRLLELGTSAIIDISDLGPDKPAFVAKFLNALVEAPRELWHPVLVVLDEAHRFAPEKGKPRKGDEEERDAVENSLAAVIRLMDAGRKRPFCGVLATQRIAKLSKDAAFEANNVLIGRCIGADARRAGEELDLKPREAKQALRRLQPGHFYVFGPAFSDEVRLFKVGKVETTHPEAGEVSPPPTPTPAEVRAVLGKLRDLPAEASEEDRTVEQLRARVKRLEAEIAATDKELRAEQERIVEKVVEVPVIMPGEIDRIEGLVKTLLHAQDRLAQAQQAVVSEVGTLASAVDSLGVPATWATAKAMPIAKLEKAVETFRDLADKPPTNDTGLPKAAQAMLVALAQVPSGLTRKQIRSVTGYADSGPTSKAFASLIAGGYVTVDGDRLAITSLGRAAVAGVEARLPELSKPERAILAAIAQHPGSTRKHVRIRTGYSDSGPTSKAFARLMTMDWVRDDGGRLSATDAGLAVLGDFEALPTGAALREQLLNGDKLSKPERTMLGIVCDVYPDAIARAELRKRAGYSDSGPTSKAMSRLIQLEYVVDHGKAGLKASEQLQDGTP